jgi:exopolysaccharide production protein ExoY
LASNTVSELTKLTVCLTASELSVQENDRAVAALDPSWPLESDDEYTSPAHVESAPAKPFDRPATRLRAVDADTTAEVSPTTTGVVPPIGGIVKRILDIAIAGTALVLLAPLLAIVALLIYATMGRPVVFAQRRLGFDGRHFHCLKFRTMITNADAALQAHLANNPEAAREWLSRQKLEHDPRVTQLGNLLRKSSIDELPQLLSVVMGHMSCVGPRPVVDAEIDRYGEYWAEYMRARPGMTGAWQVSGRNRLGYGTRVALDRYYVRKWSLRRDLWILAKTIPAVLRSDETG